MRHAKWFRRIGFLFLLSFGLVSTFAYAAQNNYEKAKHAEKNSDWAEALFYYGELLKKDPHNAKLKEEKANAEREQKAVRERKRRTQKIAYLKSNLAAALPVCEKLFQEKDSRVHPCVADLENMVLDIRQCTGQFYENEQLSALGKKLFLSSLGFFLEPTAENGPKVDRLDDGRPLLILAASVNGVSTNRFTEFSLTHLVPVIRADAETEKVLLVVNGNEATRLTNSTHVGVVGKKDVTILLVFQNPHGFVCEGCSFKGVDVAFEQGNLFVTGAGMNATHGVSVRGAKTEIRSPLLIADTLLVDGDFELSSAAYANQIELKGGGHIRVSGELHARDEAKIDGSKLHVDGLIHGLVVTVSAEDVYIAPSTEQKVGIFAQAPQRSQTIVVVPHDRRNLSVRAARISNNGFMISEGAIELEASDRMDNTKRVESKDAMWIRGGGLYNSGKIKSHGDFTLGAQHGGAMPTIDVRSGTLQSKGKMRIYADLLRVSRGGFSKISDISVENLREDHRVNVDCKTCDGWEHNADEVRFTQRLGLDINQFPAGLISSQGGIDFHVKRIENILSRIESKGDVWFDESCQPDIVVDSLHTSSRADFYFHDKYDSKPFDTNHYWWCITIIGCIGPGIAHANHQPTWRSYTIDRIYQQSDPWVRVKGVNDPWLKYDCERAGTDQLWMGCKANMHPLAADMVYNGTVFGKARSMVLNQWFKPENGDWTLNSYRDHTWRQEEIKVTDQMISLLPMADVLTRMQEMDDIAHLSGEYLKDETGLMPSGLWADSSGYAGFLSLFQLSSEIAAGTYYFSPSIEYRGLFAALSNKLGHTGVTPHELLRNTPAAMAKYGFGIGQCPTPEQIKEVDMPFLCSAFYQSSKAPFTSMLVPMAVFPAGHIADGWSQKAAQFKGEVIDLTVQGDARIDGLIKTLKGDLKLHAEMLVLHGELDSEGGIDLQANKELLLESMMDEITRKLGTRARLNAKDTIKMHSRGLFKSVGSEVSGKNIIVRAEGEMIIIPLKVFEDFSAAFKDGADEVEVARKCEMFLANSWNATGGNIDLSANRTITMVGGEFAAADSIKLKSDVGALDILPMVKKCQAFLSKRRGGYSMEYHATTETVEKTKFAAGKKFESFSKGNTHFQSVNITAPEVDIKSEQNVTIDSAKSTTQEHKLEQQSHFFEKNDEGKFVLFGNTQAITHSYNEDAATSSIDGQNIAIHSQGTLATEGLGMSAKGGKISVSGKKGVVKKDVTERHESATSTLNGGFALDMFGDAGEVSAGVGVYDKFHKTNNQGTTARTSTWEAGQGIDISSEGAISIEGGTLIGDLRMDAQSISMTPSRGCICIDTSKLTKEFSLRVGIKSRLTRALVGLVNLKDSKIETWEDGVNLGFKVFAGGIELAGGLIMPVDGGIWVRGKVAYSSKQECFDIITQPNLKSDTLTLTAEQCIVLEGAKIEGINGSIKAKCLEVKAAAVKNSNKEMSASIEGDIPVQGLNGPSITAKGSFQETTQTTQQNSQLDFKGKLQMNIEGKASFTGAVVKAKELEAEFGELLLQSLHDEFTQGGFSGSLSINPMEIVNTLKGVLGGGLGANTQTRKLVNEMTALLGLDKAKIVVKGLTKVVGAMIANAEKNPDGTYTDKGKLQFETAQLIQEDIGNVNSGALFDMHVSQGTNKAFKATVDASFGMRVQSSETRATFGQGEVKATSDDASGHDSLNNINRDVNQAQTEFHGFNLNPIHAHIPIPNLENKGEHLKAYFKALKRCATSLSCFKESLGAMWHGMTWFHERKSQSDEQKDWRKLFKNIKFLDEEEKEKILKDVEEENKPLEDKINEEREKAEEAGDRERVRNTEIAEDLLEKAKEADAAAKAAERMGFPEKEAKKNTAARLKERVKQFAGARDKDIKAALKDEIEHAKKSVGQSPYVKAMEEAGRLANEGIYWEAIVYLEALYFTSQEASGGPISFANQMTIEVMPAGVDETSKIGAEIRKIVKGLSDDPRTSDNPDIHELVREITHTANELAKEGHVEDAQQLLAEYGRFKSLVDNAGLDHGRADYSVDGDLLLGFAGTFAKLGVKLGSKLLNAEFLEGVREGFRGVRNSISQSTPGKTQKADKWSRLPKSLQDELALKAAKEGKGKLLIDWLNDPKFKGMEKWQYKVKSKAGRDTVIHYVKDPKSGKLMDFKFKKHSVD